MSKLKIVLLAIIVAVLTACGGGGGSAGTTTVGGGGTGGPAPAVSQETLLNIQLKDASGAVTQSVAASGGSEIVATLTTKTGTAIVGQPVVFDDFILSQLISFPDGKSVITDQNGVAKLKVNRISLTKFGSGLMSASFAGVSCAANCANAQFSSARSDITIRIDPPVLRLELLDTANVITTSISSAALTSIRATLKFADGTPVMQKRVEVTGDATKVTFPEGNSQLTDATGIAIIKVARAALNVSGAGNLNASAIITGVNASGSIDTTVVAGVLDYQVGVANISLVALDVGAGPLAAFGNRTVSVRANVNGVAATNSPVQVIFSASCGTTLPATVTTNAQGIASTTYSASLPICAGSNVNITASTVGAPPLSGLIAVANAIATNIQFVSTTPQLIYLKGSTGTTQAQAVFKVVDSNGTPLQNQKVRVSLSNVSTGVTLNTLGNTAAFDFTTDSAGIVSAAVFSGTVPTSLNVRAVLLDANSVETSVSVNSNLLNVASGRPTQRSLSLAVEKLSIEGGNIDGITTNVTLSMADRQGNPVPPGTQVNFVTESGVFAPAACFVPPPTLATAVSPAVPTSSCTVVLRSQGTRTGNGRVSILAYVVGEEDFVDANGNNTYDVGETFTDLGRAFRDDNGQARIGPNGQVTIVNANGVYDAGEFQVPRFGTAACVDGIGCAGDGAWGEADVRRLGTVVFATSQALINGQITPTSLSVVISDLNNNSVPTGSIVLATPVDATPDPACTLLGTSSVSVPNTLGVTSANFSFKDCGRGDAINVRVTTPLGVVTSKDFFIP